MHETLGAALFSATLASNVKSDKGLIARVYDNLVYISWRCVRAFIFLHPHKFKETMDHSDKMPFLPTNVNDDYANFALHQQEQKRKRTFRLLTAALVLFAFVPLTVWSFNNVDQNTIEHVSSKIGLKSSSAGSPAQTIKQVDLPHNYTGTFPSTKLNTTLGFEKIYVLNLAHRQDKRDEFAILSYVTDIEVEFIDGVTGAELENQTIAEYDKGSMTNGVLGCYRSHVKALRKMVEDRVETALILEDDADWDVDLRGALERMQDPMATLIGSMKKDGEKRGATPEAPYGHSLDWDQIYLGACLENAWVPMPDSKPEYNLVNGQKVDFNHAPYVVYDDESSPPLANFGENAEKMFKDYNMTIDPTDQVRKRIIQKSRDPICTAAYGVTRRGATRLLYELTRGFNSPVDLLMAWSAEDGRVESYMVFPPIISQWRIEGGGIRNSDINRPNPTKRDVIERRSRPDAGQSTAIRNSIRKNFRKLLRPKGTEMQ
jgi:GR25 family glycosyltransferase involved in LPS biosynthesis